uniref:Uncharacterized protein n=1 Tax=Meleagris gallopavo TaxID=9103 RepID=A0A803Y846_MELGA
MKKFASTRSLNKILQQCDSSSREYEEIQAVEKKWHLHLATPRKFLDKKCKMPSLFLSAPPPPKRAPSTTLTLRSKSMTAELEELDPALGLPAPVCRAGSELQHGWAGGDLTGHRTAEWLGWMGPPSPTSAVGCVPLTRAHPWPRALPGMGHP